MAGKSSGSRKWFIGGGLLLVLTLAGLKINKIRIEAGGIRNVVSLSYWRERNSGRDIYNATDRVLKRGPRGRMELLLTFDDGPHPRSGEKILDVLKEENVKATFFVVGVNVKRWPDQVRRMIAEGHEVGNHTQDHLRLDTLTPKQVSAELTNCLRNVERVTGKGMTFIRPPGMRYNPEILKEIHRQGYTLIGWNVGAKDFIPTGKVSDMNAEQAKKAFKDVTPELIAERVHKQLVDGAIILLHDNPVTAEALPRIIREARAAGYEFRTAAQFMKDIPQSITIVANPPVTRVAIGR